METKSALSSDVQVLGPLATDNYEDWSVKVKTYLTAQDVWKIVSTFDKEPQLASGKATFEDWEKKNAMALHVIQITCGPTAFSKIRNTKSARDAWKTLNAEYKARDARVQTSGSTHAKYKHVSKESSSTTKLDSSEITEDSLVENASDSLGVRNPEHPNSTSRINPGKDVNGNNDLVHMEMYYHVRSGNQDATSKLLARHPEVISSRITDMRKTVLHMAVFAGHLQMVKDLVELMSEEHLKLKDKFGYTALAETTLLGNQQMAECMLGKHKDLISITSRSGLLPVVLAVFHGKLEFARYLYRHTPLASLQEKDGFNGVRLIIQSMYTRQFGIALDLLRLDPSLAFALDRDESSPLSVLASMRCAFKSSDPLAFWKEWIYKLLERLCHPAVSYLHELLGIQQLRETKSIHEHSRELLSVMCKRISPLNVRKEKNVVSFAIFRAIKEGHHEFVKKVVDADPYVIWRRDKHRITVFQQAVLYREAKIFSLLHEHDVRDSVMDLKDAFCNNVLHMAGMLPASIRFKHIQGAVLQMQRELQWFKVIPLTLYLTGTYFHYCQN